MWPSSWWVCSPKEKVCSVNHMERINSELLSDHLICILILLRCWDIWKSKTSVAAACSLPGRGKNFSAPSTEYWKGQFSNWHLFYNDVVRSKPMNIVHNLHRYVEKLQDPPMQLISKLHKSTQILFYSNTYCSEGNWLEYVKVKQSRYRTGVAQSVPGI